MQVDWLLLVIIALALVFDFLNGMNDSGNIVATMISTGALAPRRALLLASVCEFVGPFVFGVAVAATIGSGIVDPMAVGPLPVLAAVLAGIAWNVVTLRLGVPSSSSHALVGGLVGSALATRGPEAINLEGLSVVVAALVFSPVLGFVLGNIAMRSILRLTKNATPRINTHFRQGQIATSAALALGHGTNDAQKTMGIITLALVAFGSLSEFRVPFWVVAASALAIALGVGLGGWRIIRTLGGKIYRIRPVHGFSAQATSAAVILGAALLGGPVSTAQVVGSSIIGVGSAERLSKVRWGVAGNILLAWMVTIPASAAIGGFLSLALEWLTTIGVV